ncbi:uncharacterized protein LOC107871681 [Capsicum annuum]|uniref:uncharacterized protein LOC107871681 n=1 Tax=Capsicum annuum TaxID=4072 RepID=UPI0007BF3FDB|nr:uncharacterized protein LOC107871681 [Capsicum annuum]
MKDSETVKEYSDRLLNIANKVRLLGSILADSRIVEKILVTVPKRYEATITTLENTKDLSKISLTELLNSLKAQEQRRLMRHDVTIEEALVSKHQVDKFSKKKKNQALSEGETSTNNKGKGGSAKKNFPLTITVEEKAIHHSSVGGDLMLNVRNAINLDMR